MGGTRIPGTIVVWEDRRTLGIYGPGKTLAKDDPRTKGP